MPTTLRLVSLLVLVLIAEMTTTGPDLVRSLVQQLRVRYRIGYTALAAFRIRAAGHQSGSSCARRTRGFGPIGWTRRWLGYVVPLLSSAIRHAERVALAMDARAFGASATRTERHLVPFRLRDTVFVVGFWVATVIIVVFVQRNELSLR